MSCLEFQRCRWGQLTGSASSLAVPVIVGGEKVAHFLCIFRARFLAQTQWHVPQTMNGWNSLLLSPWHCTTQNPCLSKCHFILSHFSSYPWQMSHLSTCQSTLGSGKELKTRGSFRANRFPRASNFFVSGTSLDSVWLGRPAATTSASFAATAATAEFRFLPPPSNGE